MQVYRGLCRAEDHLAMIHLIFPALLLLVRLAAGWSLVPVGEVQALGNTTDTSPYDLTVRPAFPLRVALSRPPRLIPHLSYV